MNLVVMIAPIAQSADKQLSETDILYATRIIIQPHTNSQVYNIVLKLKSKLVKKQQRESPPQISGCRAMQQK